MSGSLVLVLQPMPEAFNLLNLILDEGFATHFSLIKSDDNFIAHVRLDIFTLKSVRRRRKKKFKYSTVQAWSNGPEK